MPQLRFMSLSIGSYAGIDNDTKNSAEIVLPKKVKIDQEKLASADPDNGLMLVFPEGYPYTEVTGDQGVGKTSLISAIAECCGMEPPVNVVNKTTHDKKLTMDFVGKDGKRYNLRMTKTGISLNELIIDSETGEPELDQKGRPKTATVKTPKTRLSELVGPAGVDPYSLRSKSGAEQIQWLRSMMVADQDIIKFEKETLPKLTLAIKQRKEKKKEYQTLEALVKNDLYYKEYEKWDAYFKEVKNFDKTEEEYERAEQNQREYAKKEFSIKSLNDRCAAIEKRKAEVNVEIERLQKEIERQQAGLNLLDENLRATVTEIKDASEWVEKNKNVNEVFEAAKEAIKIKNDYQLEKRGWESMLVAKKKMDTASDEHILLDGKIEEYRKLKTQIAANFTPSVDGLEVCVPDTADKELAEGESLETREGLFYKGLPLDHLAESELWEMCVALWQKLDIKVVLVDNIANLGSQAVEQFNAFLTNGGYIFGTQMNRRVDHLKITWNTSVPK